MFIEGKGWLNEAVFPRDHTYAALKFIDNADARESVQKNWDDVSFRCQASLPLES